MSTNLPCGHESVVSDRKSQFSAAMLTLQSLSRRFSFFKIELLLELTNVASLVSFLNQSAKTHELHIRQLVAKLDSAEHDKRHAVTTLESTIERLKTELSVCQDANISLMRRLDEAGLS